MAVIRESVTSQFVDNQATTTCTKPTGLAVGDLLLAYKKKSSPTAETGWTEIAAAPYGHVITKIADAADVAASSFTFNAEGAVLYRISGYAQTSTTQTASGTIAESSTTPLTLNITPINDSSLVIIICGKVFLQGNKFLNGTAFNTYSNWQRDFDISDSSGDDHSVAVESAYLTAQTQLTSVYDDQTNRQRSLLVLVVQSRLDATFSLSPISLPVNVPATASAAANIFASAISLAASTAASFSPTVRDWLNARKSGSSWTNTPKP